MSYKGKEIAGKESSSKRKRDDDGNSVRRGRKYPTVLQFFEDAADVGNDLSDSSISGDDFLDDEFATGPEVKNEPGKAHYLPFLPKEEELSEEELENMVKERYKDGSKFVTFAEDDYETKRSVQRNTLMPSVKDPNIWKVKCKVGQERLSAFCLMQKYVDLQSLGTKLQIISAFAVEHIKGSIYIEADKQCDINEACKNLCGIFASRVASVPKNEITHLLSAQSKCNEIPEGSWARVKNGKYKGDLAQIVVVNDAQKKATVRLIPRIDLQALAEKFGGGGSAKKSNNPAPRLISSSELEEFRPLIQYRRDRDTGKFFEILDGQMLKDGYLYKKVSIDSLSCWGVTPSEEELQKFATSNNGESVDLEWLSQLYGEQKQKRPRKNDKGGEKGGGSSGSSMANSFDLHDLVCFGRKDFGIVIGKEKDDNYKILKDGSEGPVVQTVDSHELKNPLFENKFTALDQHMKPISINDTLKVLEGPLKGRHGLVKKIYRGVIFLYDENEMENNGYFCSKSQMCEKMKVYGDACNEKGGESGPSGFEDFNSSPKSPLSPKKPWVARENNRGFNQGDKEGIFSVGQKLRIRVGPLKGYLCRVLAVRYSDVTVKLDSQHKVLTVKTEHLSEVHGKGFSMSTNDNPESTFGLLGTQDSVRGWVDEAGTSAKNDSWNTAETSAVRSSWPSFPASDFSLPESDCANPFSSMDNDSKKDNSWEIKSTPNQNSSWGAASTSTAATDNDQVEGWGKKENSWNKFAATTGFGSSVADSWEKAKLSNIDQAGPSKGAGDSWGDKVVAASDQGGSWGKGENCWDKSAATTSIGIGATDNWGNKKPSIGDQTGSSKDVSNSYNKTSADGDQVGGWGKSENCWKDTDGDDGSTWGKALVSQEKGTGSSASKTEWNSTKARTENQTGGWSGTGGDWAQQEGVSEDASGWRKGGFSNKDQTGSWNKPKTFSATGGTAWDQQTDEIADKAGNDQNGSWGKSNSFGGDREFGRGNGSGGRRGTDQYGRGRSFGCGQSSGWPKESQETTWTGDGAPSGSKDQSGWGNKDQSSSWSKGKSSIESQGTCWKSGTNNTGGNGWNDKSLNNEKDGGEKEQGDGWNSAKTSDCSSASRWGQNSGWKTGISSERGGNQDSDWGKKGNWNTGESQDSDWGKKGNWNTGGNQDSDWGKKSNLNSWGRNENRNDMPDGRERGRIWNSGANQDADWGKSSNWNSGGGNEYQNDASDSRERGGNWRGGRGSSGRGGFGGRGGSDRGGFGGRGGSDRGGFRGRGRSDRGGFGGRGRGRSDREGFHGGGGSDRGGFGGRGGYQGGGNSDRGGFGGRGRGRMDQSGGWNNRNDSGEDSKHLEWNKEPNNNNNNEGWKGHDGAESWGRGGVGDKGKWQSWDSGIGNQSKGWNGEGSGWNQLKGKANGGSSTEASDLNGQGGGWNKGWLAQTSEGNTRKQPSASGGVGQWSEGKESMASVGQGETWGKQGSSGWNRGQSGSGSGGVKRDGGQSSSAWNQTSNSKEEGTGNTGEAITDSWGVKAAAEKSWDKKKDGGSMW